MTENPALPPDPDEPPLDAASAAKLFEVLAVEIRTMAGRIAAGEAGHTLQPTALVNETWLKLFGGRPRSWHDQVHFLRSAARTMRNILLDHKKKREASRSQWGPEAERALDELLLGMESRCGGDLLAVQQALDQLAEEDAEVADYVMLRFFGGRTNLETTTVLGIGERTGERHWAFARSWLQARLHP